MINKTIQKNLFLLLILTLQSQVIFSMKRKPDPLTQEKQEHIAARKLQMKEKLQQLIVLNKNHPLIKQSSIIQDMMQEISMPENEIYFSIYEENPSIYNGLVLLTTIIDSNIETVDDFVALFNDDEILNILLALSKYDIEKLDKNQNNIYFEMIMPQLTAFYAHHIKNKFYKGENILKSFSSPVSLIYQLNNLSFAQSFRRHMDSTFFNKNKFKNKLWKWVIKQIEKGTIPKNIASSIASISFARLVEIDPVHFNYTNTILDLSAVPFFIDFSQVNEYRPTALTIKLNPKQTILPNLTLNSLFSHITSLQSLHLENNNLISLPESIGNLTNLNNLYLTNNNLEFLPESIVNIRTLKRLFLDNNQLITLPKSIGNITNLIILTVSNNALTSLPESIGNLKNLKKLHLENNNLISLPESIGNLTTLQWLHLENNNVISLPNSIGQLTKLRELYVNNNELLFFPELIENLKSLKELYLQNNNLEYLPESIEQLTYLKILNLENNNLESLPESIINLPMLKTLYLKRNNFSETYIKNIKTALERTKINF